MTDFWLVRHGSIDTLDVRIAGWTPAIQLNPLGLREVAALSERLANCGAQHIYASPLDRTRATAQLLAETLACPISVCEELGELQFGDWTGKCFDELADDAHWQRFNRFRSGTRIPNGETMLEVQARAVSALLRLRADHPDGRVVLVTHGDVIKAVVAYVLGMPLDFYDRLEIAPASITQIVLHEHTVRLLRLNDSAHVCPPPSAAGG
jgi:broad specificity phosphatase PhoE